MHAVQQAMEIYMAFVRARNLFQFKRKVAIGHVHVPTLSEIRLVFVCHFAKKLTTSLNLEGNPTLAHSVITAQGIFAGGDAVERARINDFTPCVEAMC